MLSLSVPVQGAPVHPMTTDGQLLDPARLASELASAYGADTVAHRRVFLLTDQLRRAEMQVLVHEHLPCNDGATSAGQAAVAVVVLQSSPEDAREPA